MFVYEIGALVENKYTDVTCNTLVEQVGYYTVPSCIVDESDDGYGDDSNPSIIQYNSYSFTGSTSSSSNTDKLSTTETALVSLVVIFGIAAAIACFFWYKAMNPKSPLSQSIL